MILLALGFLLLGALAVSLIHDPLSHARPKAASASVAPIPQGTQADDAYATSFANAHVTNVDVTARQVSCYTPEVPYFANLGPNDEYSGMSACNGAATTGEALGPYPTQAGSNPGYPAATPMLVKDHSESDIRVDPTNPKHLIGSSKWIVSAEGYNHLLGFYESWDGGQTWPVQGHIPGYEGWTDNTDPIGAFDSYGNYYELMLPYQFIYKADGSHDYTVGTSQEANPAVPSQAIAVAVRRHGASAATDWMSTRNGQPDYVATYDSIGNGPDKQWIAIDTNPASPHFDTIYAMWVDFHSVTPVPFVSTAKALPDGTHTGWTKPQALPEPPHTPTGATYLLPHIAADGTVYTPITNSAPKQHYSTTQIFLDASTDGGASWSVVGTVNDNVTAPPSTFANTTFRDGIEDTFAVGAQPVGGHYPLYVSYEDYSAGVANVLLTTSSDGGVTWSAPIQVNDNASAVDEFQPNLSVAASGTVSVAFYDRRLACPTQGAEASAAGLALDTSNPKYGGPLPPYGASNYCVNASIQFYSPALAPLGHNIRLTQHAWDPQLNSPTENIAGQTTFIGDYFGNIADGATEVTSFVSTYDDGANPAHRQQQIVATVAIP